MNELKGKVIYLLLIAMFTAVFFGGYYTRGYLDHSNVTSDTTTVVTPVTPPGIIHSGPIAGTVKPDTVFKWKTKAVPDTNAIIQATGQLQAEIDSLLAEKDSLKSRLTTLLAPHYGFLPFSSKFAEGQGTIEGQLGMKYSPIPEEFEAQLQFTNLSYPVTTITNTKHSAWWVKPLVFVGGGLTAYYAQDKNVTGALVAGGSSLVLILVEF
jgi:hypothetical protein